MAATHNIDTADKTTGKNYLGLQQITVGMATVTNTIHPDSPAGTLYHVQQARNNSETCMKHNPADIRQTGLIINYKHA